MPNNRLDFESIDQVEVFKENGDIIGTVKVSGVRSIEAAIEKALQHLPEAKDPEAYVFKVSNLSDGTERRYRLNAHGHVNYLIFKQKPGLAKEPDPESMVPTPWHRDLC